MLVMLPIVFTNYPNFLVDLRLHHADENPTQDCQIASVAWPLLSA